MKQEYIEEETKKYESLGILAYIENFKKDSDTYGKVHPKLIETILKGLAIEKQNNLEKKCKDLLVYLGLIKREKADTRR